MYIDISSISPLYSPYRCLWLRHTSRNLASLGPFPISHGILLVYTHRSIATTAHATNAMLVNTLLVLSENNWINATNGYTLPFLASTHTRPPSQDPMISFFTLSEQVCMYTLVILGQIAFDESLQYSKQNVIATLPKYPTSVRCISVTPFTHNMLRTSFFELRPLTGPLCTYPPPRASVQF